MQHVAMGWLVYRLTHSVFVLGLVGFLSDFPGAAVVLFAGVLLDRISPYRVVLATQALAMLLALLLAALVWTDHVGIGVILVLACLLGLSNGFDVPARQVLVTQLIDDEADLPNAIALNSLVYDLARLLGPPLGGVLVAAVGEWLCFLINGTSFLVVIIALLAMRGWRPIDRSRAAPAFGMLVEGVHYAYSTAMIRAVLLLVAVVAFAAAPYATLLPVLAARLLQSGPHAMGILMGAMAAGSLIGAFFVGQSSNSFKLDRTVMSGAALFGLCLALFAASQSLILSSAALMVAGFGVTLFMASANTLLISLSQTPQRGRVMSLFTLSFMGTVPIGALIAGLVAERIGAPMTLGAGGIICMLAAMAFGARLPQLRAAIPRSDVAIP
jgi:MFS family permease